MSDLIRRSDAIKAIDEDFNTFIAAAAFGFEVGLNTEKPKGDMPLEDGTLVVTVDDATKVGRVLVQDDQKRGGLYYADEPQEREGE